MSTNLQPGVLEALLEPIIERIIEEKIKQLKERLSLYRDLYNEPERPIKLCEMSKILGHSTSHLYRLTSKDLIPHYILSSGRVLFFQSEINE